MNCKECVEGKLTECKTCNYPYTLNATSKTCYYASAAKCNVLNCKDCYSDDANKCFSCNKWYTRAVDGSNCTAPTSCAPSNCVKCETGSTINCQTCEKSYYLDFTKSCSLKCGIFCKTCKRNDPIYLEDRCIECNEGVTFNSSKI